MGRMATGWRLTKECAGVISDDKALIVYPIVAGLAQLAVIAAFAVPFWAAGAFSASRSGITAVEVIAIIAFYFVSYFVIAFCSAALVGAALIRLRGGDPTVGDGFSMAMKHVGTLVGWAAIGATIGLIISLIQDKLGAAGQIVGGLATAAWGIVTFLVVPTIVAEDLGPGAAIKRSTKLLKQTWGEQLTGRFAIGAIFGLIVVLTVIVAIVVIVGAAMVSTAAGIIAGVVFFLLLLALIVLSQTFNGVFSAALYQFTTTGDPGQGFDTETMRASLVPSRRQRKQADTTGGLLQD